MLFAYWDTVELICRADESGKMLMLAPLRIKKIKSISACSVLKVLMRRWKSIKTLSGHFLNIKTALPRQVINIKRKLL